MSWILLLAAGLLEVVWASLLPSTEGLTRPWPTAAFLLALAASMYGLARATETIPIGTGYVVWVGIGAVGAAAGATAGAAVGADADGPGVVSVKASLPCTGCPSSDTTR